MKMRTEWEENLCGAGYYPDFFSKEECENDLKNMKEAILCRRCRAMTG